MDEHDVNILVPSPDKKVRNGEREGAREGGGREGGRERGTNISTCHFPSVFSLTLS